MAATQSFGAVLLLGQPGVGKSLLSQALCKAQGPAIRSLNVGEELRTEGLLQAYFEHPSEAGRLAVSQRAQELVQDACRDLVAEKEAGNPKVLVLEAVKDVEDAYFLLGTLRDHGIPLLQVILLHESAGRTLSVNRSLVSVLSDGRNRERLVEERQAKWAANAGRLLEIFSSQGVLVEAVGGRQQYPDRRQLRARHAAGGGSSSSSSQQWVAPTNPPAGSLAALGCAPGFCPDDAASLPPASSTWLQAAGWCTADCQLTAVPGLFLHHIEPVVSPRLVTDAAERSRVLAAAAATTGLRPLAEGSFPFAVPADTAACPSDARWLACPGRYHVSRKCDGTRHLLLAAEGGGAYLLNRAGMLYRFPLAGASSTAQAGCGATADTGSGGSAGSGRRSSGTGGELAAGLPAGTCLDGELVWIGPAGASPGARRGFFLAFDALAVGQSPVWQLSLPERLERLAGLHLQEAESSAALREVAGGSGGGSAGKDKGKAPLSAPPPAGDQAQAAPAVVKKQQAPPPGSDSLTLLLKRHMPVSSAALEELEASRPACPYPTDGLVFTPSTCPYSLAMPQLLLKWQPPEQAAVDLSGAELQAMQPEPVYGGFRGGRGGRGASAPSVPWDAAALVGSLPRELVFECLPLHPTASPATAAPAPAGKRAAAATRTQPRSWVAAGGRGRRERAEGKPIWVPGSVRWDKRHGNSAAAVASLGRRTASGRYLSHPMLVGAVREVEEAVAARQAGAAAGQAPVAAPCHPARQLPLADLYRTVSAEVEAGRVERWEEAESGLEVYSYRMDPAVGPPATPAAAMCRGLVLHPASATVVATPFVRFGAAGEGAEGGQAKEHGQQAEEDALLPGGAADAANLALYRSHDSGGTAASLASASFKVDGSLIIAFLWQGGLYTTTRRRMDSEQAVWARAWLQERGVAPRLEPGWTYLFEAVYQHNTSVIEYPFEGLVLLSAVGLDGCELCCGEPRQALARRLGTLAAPWLEGPEAELLSRLTRGTAAAAAQGSASADGGGIVGAGAKGARPPAPPTFEGWVLETAAGRRMKLVQAAFLQAGAAAVGLMHPLLLWDAVRCGGASRAQLAAGLPPHMQREMHAELDALQLRYRQAAALLAAAFDRAQRGQLDAEGGGGQSGEVQLEGLMEGLSLEDLSACFEGVPALSSEESTQLLSSPSFQAALRLALQAGTADAGPMFLRPDWRLASRLAGQGGPSPLLRGLLLACVPPGTDGSLPGYSPSPAFAQTHAKGWARSGPRGRRGAYLAAVAAGEEPPGASEIDAVLEFVLPHADGRSLVAAQLVSKRWRQAVADDPACQAAIAEAKAAAIAEAKAELERRLERRRRAGLAILLGMTFGSDSEDEPHLHGFDGYGSF